MSDLQRNAEKMQKILYELALVHASGRRTMKIDSTSAAPTTSKSSNDNDDDE